ncbi:hypothetical protein CSOJ01_12401 [Colletotrichum sojae]|uniref:BZIP domain-containing protein n=1 Tax=Colletotrichum sojae TaxID=2175907 RepID=A0A8H6MLN1_9PEZI|nr:hypothetical protein CSOJ01_12401 [Colletotrichum sojae]
MASLPVNMLPPMLHSSEARCPDDDWTGLRDRAERRKRQNRLNVRAHRKKKALEARQKQKEASRASGTPALGPPASGPPIQILQWVPPTAPTRAKIQLLSRSSSEDDIPVRNTQAVVRSPDRRRPSRFGPRQKTGRKPPYFQTPDRWFPLYRDHLIPLVYYNVFRATITNINILSLTFLIDCNTDLENTPLFPAPSQVPPTLLPTAFQRSTPHEAWIDIFPSGAMRDNAIRYRDSFDHSKLCMDLVGCQEGQAGDQPGIIAWSDPWHPDGWEVTEKFVEKWGFLLKGCEDHMRATNRWRAMRDEEPLVWELE